MVVERLQSENGLDNEVGQGMLEGLMFGMPLCPNSTVRNKSVAKDRDGALKLRRSRITE